MRRLRAQWHRLGGLFRRGALEREMNEELQAHLDGLIERNVEAGMTPHEARYAALRAFGGVAQIQERARDERRSVWLEQLGQDVRYAVRALVRSPSFTVTAVLTLALGVGVNAALFSLFNKVALQPLPLKDPENLVRIEWLNTRGTALNRFNYAEYVAYRDGNESLDGLLASCETRWSFESDVDDEADLAFDVHRFGTLPVELVSENYFDVLGGQLQLGRAFLPEVVRAPGGAPVIVLSNLFWVHHFRRDPNVIGTTVRLRHQKFTVIGVAAPSFSGQSAAPPAGWLPLTTRSSRSEDYDPRSAEVFGLVGRLKLGISDTQAKADLDGLVARWAADFPGERSKASVRLKRGLRVVNIPLTPLNLARLSPLILGFGMVLFIACTNVTNLLLARGVSRQPEIGVRLSLGASRGRIVRQLLTENLLLCLLGAAVGLVLGVWTLQLLENVMLAPLMSESWLDFLKPTIDLRVLSFTALLTVGTALVAGLLPALNSVRSNLHATMRKDGTTLGGRFTPSRLRQVLVVLQVALCLTLLSCAGVIARDFFTLRRVDVGYDAHAIFSASIAASTSGNGDHGAEIRHTLERLKEIPAIAAVGSAGNVSLPMKTPTRIRRVDANAGTSEEDIGASFVTIGFFPTFEIPLQRGRIFQDLEQHSASHVILVSESLARHLWPEQEAVGRTLAVSESRWATRERPAPDGAFRECEVIGVVRDITMRVDEENHFLMYLPLPLDTAKRVQVFIRPRNDSAKSLAEIVRAAEVEGIALEFDERLSILIEQQALPFYLVAFLSGVLGCLALGMACVGLYGLMTFVVSQREREIGIRVALGATAKNVISLFVGQGMRLVAVGLALGLIGGVLCALLLVTLLPGFAHAFDPIVFCVVTLLFAVIAFLACWLPSLRATKVDPVVALRAE